MTELHPCPFCGNEPELTNWEWRDDRRYVASDIKCCCTMTVSIGWPKARDMTDREIREELYRKAIESWNTSRNFYEEFVCAENILDCYAAGLNLENTDFDCIGDYITAVVEAIKKQPEVDNRPICSADGCNRREPCGPYCWDNGNFN